MTPLPGREAPDVPEGPNKVREPEMAKRGRPTVYSPELAKCICDLLATGYTLNEVCRQPDMPDDRTVREWATDPRHPFSPLYTRAREIGYHKMADDLLEIVDNSANDWMRRAREDGVVETVLDREHILRTEMRFKARQWLLSKALPKIYGDRLNHDVSGEIVHTTPEQRRATIEALLRKRQAALAPVIDGKAEPGS